MSSRRTAAIALVLAIACAFTLFFAGCGSTPKASSAESGSPSSATTESADTSSAPSAIDDKIASMTLEQKVAQLFIVSPGTLSELGDGSEDPMVQYPVGGFIYLEHDLDNPEQTRAMLDEVQQRSQSVIGLPAFTCVDEEGGTVVRVANNPTFGVQNVGDMQAIGTTGDAKAARDAANYIGTYLADLHFNVDFAPVADLASGDDSMSQRSFGTDANLVSDMVSAQVEGFTEAGVLCAVKHFPGIGGIAEDSHIEGIVSPLNMSEFRNRALKPFRAGIDAGAPFVMTGHLNTPNATNDDIPASVSPTWITDVLRKEMRFDGVVITDALEMDAVDERYSQYNLGALALEAGADVLLKPTDFPAMYQGVLDAVARGELSEKRIDESLRRVLQAKEKLSV